MLDEITPNEFSELIEAECVGLDVDEWWRVAHLSAVLYAELDEIRALIETHLTQKVAKLRPKAVKDFLPANYQEQLE